MKIVPSPELQKAVAQELKREDPSEKVIAQILDQQFNEEKLDHEELECDK